ncbi:pseudouridylate synthase [Anaerococcus lactolyticus ATCC 51172]|uniref:Pseudouridine synthase n=1 Tax=Anaerococcus lactolyticus ATCC 51172 TaxID=525254 RepID=C2BDN8_9FIRM|nr:pseudouridine synthase [Anaerococcus lactolyticus]EEI86903.1 pseudouridylate synthase [Anaerococcus lactolyticus ATCC 51172]
MRINKFIAHAGYTSRRKADELILKGKVKINDEVILEPGIDVCDDDRVEVEGKVLSIEKKFYIKLYKPVGFITSNFDPYNEKDLNELVDIDKRFFAAGRLDKDSEGLLIITNDGEFTNNLIHPKYKLDKEYIVKVDKKLKDYQEKQFAQGLDIGNGEKTSDAKIEYLENNTYRVIIHQGYNRQIRRMFKVFGIKVVSLKRIRIGKISLSNLKEKEYRYFNEDELKFVEEIRR